MSILSPLPRTEDAVELIDGPVPFADLSECLADLARINTLFGGTWVTLTHVKQLLSRLPLGQAVTVVDVGAGAGDIPRALVRWARRTGRPIRVFALDRDFATLRVAGRFLGSYPEITLVQGDALALPVRAGSVDVTISALTLHHLNRGEAVRYLRELDAAARLGIVVNDLVRSRVAYVLVWLTTRVLARSRIARHDGPVSVLRAYTPDEARQLCEQAGLCNVEVMHYVTLLRQCAIRRGPRAADDHSADARIPLGSVLLGRPTVFDGLVVLIDNLLEMAIGHRLPRSPIARTFIVLSVLAFAAAIFVVWRNWGLLTPIRK